MKKEVLKTKIGEIRLHVMKSDLDGATEKLTALAAQFGEDVQDEAVTISANWNQLERDIRSSLIRPAEAQIRQNQLIDRILSLTRDLEKEAAGENTGTGDRINRSGLLIVAAIAGLVLMYFLLGPVFNKSGQAEEGSMTEKTEVTRKEPQTVSEDAELPKKEESARPPAMESKNETSTRPAAEESNKDLTTRPATEPPQKEELAEEAIAVPEDRENEKNKMEEYYQLYERGAKAYHEKSYEEAYKLLDAALKLNKTEEVLQYIRPLRELLYNEYRIRGMDAMNAGDYAFALKAFKKAQTYKDFAQIRGLISRCERKLSE